ncbi:MAG: hypothetical protein Q4D33_05835 [Prevotellaceae bacterium]|nr:hypothetical protein [Prevotellaceae bacterium]
MTKAVEFYNNERPHMSLDNMTPRQAASYKGKINKKWTSYREKYLQNLEIKVGFTTFVEHGNKSVNFIDYFIQTGREGSIKAPPFFVYYEKVFIFPAILVLWNDKNKCQ